MDNQSKLGKALLAVALAALVESLVSAGIDLLKERFAPKKKKKGKGKKNEG